MVHNFQENFLKYTKELPWQRYRFRRYLFVIVLLVSVFFSGHSACRCLAAESLLNTYTLQLKAPKWSIVEISLVSSEKFTNPYCNIELFGNFYGPDGQKLVVKGFWDGDRRFKIRFTPTAPGQWQFSTTSVPHDTGLVQKGEFIATPATENSHGFLRRDDEFPRSFIFDDGSRYFMVGQTYYAIIRQAWNNSNWFEAIEKSSQYGFSKFRILMWPWNKLGRMPKVSPFIENDLDRVDVRFFQKFDDVIEKIAANGLVVDLIIWKDSKNAHGTLEQDVRYLQYVLSRYAAFPNVIWTLANEWEYSGYGPGKEWYWDQMGEYVRSNDPWFMEADRLRPLSIHQQTHHTFKWSHSDWPVHAIIQDGVWNGHHEPPRFVNGDEWGNYGIVKNLSLRMPVVNDEFGYFGQKFTKDDITTVIDRGQLRRAMWGIYVAGGYGSLGDDTGGQSALDRVKAFIRKMRGKTCQGRSSVAQRRLARYSSLSRRKTSRRFFYCRWAFLLENGKSQRSGTTRPPGLCIGGCRA